jgi:hypothetical protein
MKRKPLKEITAKDVETVLLTKQQQMIVDLAIHFYTNVIETVPVDTGLTRHSFTIGVNTPDKYEPSEGHYGISQAPSAKAILSALRGKELKIFIGTAVDHKGYIEMIYQTQTLAWYDLAKYAQQTYPKVFK